MLALTQVLSVKILVKSIGSCNPHLSAVFSFENSDSQFLISSEIKFSSKYFSYRSKELFDIALREPKGKHLRITRQDPVDFYR
jgi:hypothetical protein